MAIEPNNNFFSEKPAEKPVEKPIPKMELPAKSKVAKKAVTKKETTKASATNSKPKEKIQNVVVSQEQYDLEKAKYPEYFALSDYHKKCLIATNYWRVLNGMPIIEVPAQYTYYHKYFDKRCYDLAKDYQEKRDRINQQKELAKNNKPSEEEKVIEVLVKVERNEMYAKDAVEEINKITGLAEPKKHVGGFEIEPDATETKIEIKEKVSKKVIKEKAEADVFNDAVKKTAAKKQATKVEKQIENPEVKKEEPKKEDNNNEPQLSLF